MSMMMNQQQKGKGRRNMLKRVVSGLIVILGLANQVWAADGMDSGNTAWVLVSAALVMMMTPAGLALFYGGMSRYKNLLNTTAMTYMSFCIASVVWVVVGYSLAFGPDRGGIIGGLDYLLMKSLAIDSLQGNIPVLVFAVFQMTFAGITVALILGAIVDRMKFASWLVFVVLWVVFVYCPVAHWVWGGGWMAKMGALDFAGGNVVHINAGIAGLVLTLMLGKRNGFGKEPMIPSSISLTALGSAMLWFGWFGFNAGSQLAADGLAGMAFLVTNTSASIAAVFWMLSEWITRKKPTLLGMASGAVAGLVAITPAAGFVGLGSSLVIGAVAGVLGFFSVSKLKAFLNIDDSLDAFGVHGVCGMWGALSTGIFADPAINAAGKGLIAGNGNQVIIQLISIVGTAVFSAVGTWVVVKVTGWITAGIRVDSESEIEGLDSATHGERAFEIQV